MLGISMGDPCGVRDYALVLGDSLRDCGASLRVRWWERDPAWSFREATRRFLEWSKEASTAAGGLQPDLIVWHYSVFAWGWRGIPVFALPWARSLAGMPAPVVGILHEMAYPFRPGPWRANVWAISQRAGLVPLVRASDGVLVTTDERARWVTSRRWLPARPTAVFPVWSNLPPPRAQGLRLGDDVEIGVFGYGAEDFVAEPVVEAVASLKALGLRARLLLVGAPGPESRQGMYWRRAAQVAGCDEMLGFTGKLEPQMLSSALAGVDVIVHPDIGGPSSRKTTLAAALACGKPIVALDGRNRWELLVDEGAVVLACSSNGIASAIESFLSNPELRLAQGDRAGAFYRKWMKPEALAAEILAFGRTLPGGLPDGSSRRPRKSL